MSKKNTEIKETTTTGATASVTVDVSGDDKKKQERLDMAKKILEQNPNIKELYVFPVPLYYSDKARADEYKKAYNVDYVTVKREE